MPKNLRTYPRWMKGEELLFTAQYHGNSLILAYRFVFKYLFNYYSIALLPARVAAHYRSIIVHPVGLYEWKLTTTHPILTIMFKNILRTFEAEILKMFKFIQSHPLN